MKDGLIKGTGLVPLVFSILKILHRVRPPVFGFDLIVLVVKFYLLHENVLRRSPCRAGPTRSDPDVSLVGRALDVHKGLAKESSSSSFDPLVLR